MDEVVRRYMRLGLRLGRLEEGLVDTYFGPAEVADAVRAEPEPTPAEVVAEAGQLLRELPDGWLRDQVTAVRTYAGVLAGERFSFAQQMQGCYGVRLEFTAEEVFEQAHERLAQLLPGPGPLRERYLRWREATVVPVDKVETLVANVIELSRAWTGEFIGLPAGESVELDFVGDQAWSGFHHYQGDLRGRMQVNVSSPRPVMELLHLTMHETYPGHQAERALKDQLLVRQAGRLEESIVLGPTPQSLVSEGIAEAGPGLVLESPVGAAIAAACGFDLAEMLAVQQVAETLRWAEVNAAMLRHDRGADADEVSAYLCRWELLSGELAEGVIRFMDEPGNSTYLALYPAGQQRCRAYLDGDPKRLRRLLTEQVRAGDL